MRNLNVIILLVSTVLTGCGTQRFALKPTPLVAPTEVRVGSLAVKVTDKRENKQKIGVLRGGFGNELGDIVLTGDLKNEMAMMLTDALQKTGYSVVSSTNTNLEADILMFVADSTGHGKFARHKIQIRLRDDKGDIRWEKPLLGEAAGMLFGASSVERAMNLALDRLLSQALDEFSSEFFSQTVKKMNQGQ